MYPQSNAEKNLKYVVQIVKIHAFHSGLAMCVWRSALTELTLPLHCNIFYTATFFKKLTLYPPQPRPLDPFAHSGY